MISHLILNENGKGFVRWFEKIRVTPSDVSVSIFPLSNLFFSIFLGPVIFFFCHNCKFVSCLSPVKWFFFFPLVISNILLFSSCISSSKCYLDFIVPCKLFSAAYCALSMLQMIDIVAKPCALLKDEDENYLSGFNLSREICCWPLLRPNTLFVPYFRRKW